MLRPIPAASLAAALLLAPVGAIAQSQCSLAPAAGTVSAQPSPPANMVAAPPDQNPARGLVEFPPADVARFSALRNVVNAGAKVYELPTPPELEGLRTAFAVNGSAFQVFYVPQHGAAVIRGIAQGPSGENLTLAQTSAIPGVVPAIDIRDDAALVDGSAVKTAAAAAYGLWGRDGAPRVFMFMDPLCSFSLRAMTLLKPAVDAGRLAGAAAGRHHMRRAAGCRRGDGGASSWDGRVHHAPCPALRGGGVLRPGPAADAHPHEGQAPRFQRPGRTGQAPDRPRGGLPGAPAWDQAPGLARPGRHPAARRGAGHHWFRQNGGVEVAGVGQRARPRLRRALRRWQGTNQALCGVHGAVPQVWTRR